MSEWLAVIDSMEEDCSHCRLKKRHSKAKQGGRRKINAVEYV